MKILAGAAPLLLCALLCSCANAEPPAPAAGNGGAASAHTAALRARATTSIALTVASASSGTGTGVILVATVDGKSQASPAGSVVFTVQGKAIGQSAVSNGSASLTLNSLPTGVSSLAAAYEGDSNFLPSQSATVRFYNDDQN